MRNIAPGAAADPKAAPGSKSLARRERFAPSLNFADDDYDDDSDGGGEAWKDSWSRATTDLRTRSTSSPL